MVGSQLDLDGSKLGFVIEFSKVLGVPWERAFQSWVRSSPFYFVPVGTGREIST